MDQPKRKPGRPPTGQTPGHNVRMPHDRWRRFGEAAKAIGLDRSEALNRFAAWLAHEPGAKLPKRPELPAPSADDEPQAAEQPASQ